MHNDKTVLVTGASSGIGLAIAKRFLELGFKVYGTARNPEKTDPTTIQGINMLSLDITDTGSARACIDQILKKESKIDILVNNAGYGLMGPIAELSLEDLNIQFQTNVIGTIALTQMVIPAMVASGSGMIVNIISIAAVLSTAFSGAYCASKAAMNSFSEVMRIELKPFNINVVAVQPGAIKSNFGINASKNLERYGKNSLYISIAGYIEKRAMVSQQNTTSAEEFAFRLIKKLLKPNPPGLIRIGKESFKLPLLKSILPAKILESMISRRFGLDKLIKA